MNHTPTPAPADAAPCIFLVDDDHLMLQATRLILSRNGYRIRCFSNPLEAMTALFEGRELPALVVSDVDMPEINGFELFRRVRASHSHLPFLFVTGSPAHLRGRDPHGELGVDLLRKPFTTDGLLRAVGALTGVPRS